MSINEQDFYCNCVSKKLCDSNGLYKRAITEFFSNSYNRGNFTLYNLSGFLGGVATDYTWQFSVGNIGSTPRESGDASVAGNIVTADISPCTSSSEILELWAVSLGKKYLAAQVKIIYISGVY